MTLELVLKIIGWIMVIIPVMTYVSVTAWLIVKTAEAEDTLKAVVMIGMTSFILGVGILAVLHFTDWLL